MTPLLCGASVLGGRNLRVTVLRLITEVLSIIASVSKVKRAPAGLRLSVNGGCREIRQRVAVTLQSEGEGRELGYASLLGEQLQKLTRSVLRAPTGKLSIPIPSHRCFRV